ncbi:MAG: carbohydrate-binding domain-containing protein [Acutalibacteraceae bacterium]
MTITGGTYTIATGDDGVHADNAVSISDCTVDILESYEGLEGLTVTFTGGTISVTASDDGVNAAGGADSSGFGGGRGDAFAAQSGAYIAISGGSLTVDAGGDGLDSDGDLSITGGTTLVAGPISGADSALDHDGQATITGGIFAATGSVGMAQTFSADGSTQPSMLIAVSPDMFPVRSPSGQRTARNCSPGKLPRTFPPSSSVLRNWNWNAHLYGDSRRKSTDVTLDTLSYQSEGVGGIGGGRGGMERGERPDRAPDDASSAPGSSGESESEA